MEDVLVPIALFVSIAVALVGTTKIVSDGLTKRNLIRSGASPELAAALMAEPDPNSDLLGALKWGLLVGSVGLAFILLQFLPYQTDQPIMLGVVLVFAAGGFLAYFTLARRLTGRDLRVAGERPVGAGV